MKNDQRYLDVKYLKHCGDQMDVKVSVSTLNDEVRIFIHDFEFTDTGAALKYLQRFAEEQRSRSLVYGKRNETEQNG